MTKQMQTQKELDYANYLIDKNYETLDDIFNRDLAKVRRLRKSVSNNQCLIQCRDCLVEVLYILMYITGLPPFEHENVAKDFINLNHDIHNLYGLMRCCVDLLTHGVTTKDTLDRKREALRHLVKAASLLGIQTEEKIQATIDHWAKHHELEGPLNFIR